MDPSVCGGKPSSRYSGIVVLRLSEPLRRQDIDDGLLRVLALARTRSPGGRDGRNSAGHEQHVQNGCGNAGRSESLGPRPERNRRCALPPHGRASRGGDLCRAPAPCPGDDRAPGRRTPAHRAPAAGLGGAAIVPRGMHQRGLVRHEHCPVDRPGRRLRQDGGRSDRRWRRMEGYGRDGLDSCGAAGCFRIGASAPGCRELASRAGDDGGDARGRTSCDARSARYGIRVPFSLDSARGPARPGGPRFSLEV